MSQEKPTVWVAWFPQNGTPPPCSDILLWFAAKTRSFHLTHSACLFLHLMMLQLAKPTRSILCPANHPPLPQDSAFSQSPCSTSTPYTQTSELGSTLSCLTPVTFPPSSQHGQHTCWLAQVPSQHSGAHSPQHTSCCLASSTPGLVVCQPSRIMP